MRTLLDRLYRGCAALAAAFLALIAVLVVAQVAGRLRGVLVPGADELASFSLVASSFLALGPTLRAGVHIRVTLLVRRASPTWRRWLELWCHGFGAVVAGYFTYHVFAMARDAFRFGEKSQGVLPIPLWAPQCGMLLGIAVLTIAFLDELVGVLRRGTPSYPDGLETLDEPGPAAVAGR